MKVTGLKRGACCIHGGFPCEPDTLIFLPFSFSGELPWKEEALLIIRVTSEILLVEKFCSCSVARAEVRVNFQSKRFLYIESCSLSQEAECFGLILGSLTDGVGGPLDPVK